MNKLSVLIMAIASVIGATIIVPIAAANYEYEGKYNCNYPSDESRGIKVVRAVFEISHDRSCLSFWKYGVSRELGEPTCGVYNTSYGRRESANGISSLRFDGFATYNQVGGASIPTARRRFAIFEFDTDKPGLFIRGDRRNPSDAEYVCIRVN